MPTEIEHKFLVTGDSWRSMPGTRYIQGYLAISQDCVVRARAGGGAGYLTVKSSDIGTRRLEYEYEIPESEAREMIERLCGGRIIEKTRHRVPLDKLVWEVDEFHGGNAGLILAEIELEYAGQQFTKPDWVGAEVSFDPRYTSARLAVSPFTSWSS